MMCRCIDGNTLTREEAEIGIAIQFIEENPELDDITAQCMARAYINNAKAIKVIIDHNVYNSEHDYGDYYCR